MIKKGRPHFCFTQFQRNGFSHPPAMFRDVVRPLLCFEGKGDQPQNFLKDLGPAGLAYRYGRHGNLIEFGKQRFDSLFRGVSHGEQGKLPPQFPT